MSIEFLTFRDFRVISWVTSYWDILKWHLSDHLISLLKWKYGVLAFFCRVERRHTTPEKIFTHKATFCTQLTYFFTIFIMVNNFFFHKNILKRPDYIWWRSTRQKKAYTPYFHLSKRIKWSLNCHLSISRYEVTHEMTPKSWKVKTSIENNHLI